MADSARDASETADVDSYQLKRSIAAFITGAVSFFAGTALATQTRTPFSSTPVISMANHMLWGGGVPFLAIGAVALIRGVDSLRTGLAGYLAIGALGLGTLTGFQWAILMYIDVQAAQNAPTDEYERILEALISPIGAGHALMYGMLVGSGVHFLAGGFAARRSLIGSSAGQVSLSEPLHSLDWGRRC